MIYAFAEGSAKWKKHDAFGFWSISFSDTGDVLDNSDFLRIE